MRTSSELSSSFHRFHQAACDVLGIDPERRGAKSEVAKAVGLSRQRYGDFLRGDRGSLDTLAECAAKLRLRLVVDDGEVTFVPAKRRDGVRVDGVSPAEGSIETDDGLQVVSQRPLPPTDDPEEIEQLRLRIEALVREQAALRASLIQLLARIERVDVAVDASVQDIEASTVDPNRFRTVEQRLLEALGGTVGGSAIARALKAILS